MKKTKKAYSVRLEDDVILSLKTISDEYDLQPADLIRVAVKSLIKSVKKNKGELTLPFRHPNELIENIPAFVEKDIIDAGASKASQIKRSIYNKRK